MIIFTWGIKIGINIYITRVVASPGAIVKNVKVTGRITATSSIRSTENLQLRSDST